MIDYELLKDMLIKHEGLRLKPYKDTVGKLTIGIGRNLDDRGISKSEAMFLLQNDIDDTIATLEHIDFYQKCNDARKIVLINMVFNMGFSRALGFKKMIAAIHHNQWDLAADEMLDSRWANQVGHRALELAHVMRTGEI